MIAIAIVLVFLAPVMFAAPGTMYVGPTPSWLPVVPLLGVVGVIVGLAWMIRIHRANPEPDQHAWRYRADR
jgi:hypothetical protein